MDKRRPPVHLLLVILTMQVLVIIPSPTYQQQQSSLSSVDIAALASVKDSLIDLPGSNFFSSWDFSSSYNINPCSTFAGITCSLFDNVLRVTTLTLGTGLTDSPGLAGSLSPAIADLTFLTQLVVFPGLVSGPIPDQLGRLANLRVVSLTNNRLTGSIPISVSLLPNLHTLDLSYNRLTGWIPPPFFIGPMSKNLRVVILAGNKLSGNLPRMVWTELLHLDLKGNMLSGELPLRLPSSLRYLSVSRNKMWGPLNGLVSLSDLVYLDLSMNYFSGPIPLSLFRPTLSSLFLQRNNLSGGTHFLSTSNYPHEANLLDSVHQDETPSVIPYRQGSIVDLSHNALSGELSPLLAGAETLFLNNNRLTGTVPREYVDSLRGGITNTLYLQHNYLTWFPSPLQGLPDTTSLCLSYNCILDPPRQGLTSCPSSAGDRVSRPASQCHGVLN